MIFILCEIAPDRGYLGTNAMKGRDGMWTWNSLLILCKHSGLGEMPVDSGKLMNF